MIHRKASRHDISPQLLLPWHPGRTVSTTRAAELLGCSQSTILRMVEEGDLEGFKRRRRNSPYLIIYESILRLADEWNKLSKNVHHQRASDAPAIATAPPREPRRR